MELRARSYVYLFVGSPVKCIPVQVRQDSPRLALLLGIEAVKMRICHDKENIACFDFSQNSFVSISSSSTFAVVFLRLFWVPISGIHGCIRD